MGTDKRNTLALRKLLHAAAKAVSVTESHHRATRDAAKHATEMARDARRSFVWAAIAYAHEMGKTKGQLSQELGMNSSFLDNIIAGKMKPTEEALKRALEI